MRILFTGIGRRIELVQAFRSAALALGIELKIIGTDLTGTAPALAFCDEAYICVPMKDPDYIDCLLNICLEKTIDLVIPTIDTDLLILSENRKRFEKMGIKVMISAPDLIRACRDKNMTYNCFTEHGLRAPVTVSRIDDYRYGFPAFIKPKDGSSSINAFKVENEKELIELSKRIKDYIIQPFIGGQEYTVDIFCNWSGKPIWITPRKRLQVRAGEVLKTEIYMDRRIISDMKRFCEEIKPCGPVTIQLIRDSNGIDWYIEINPRFGGGAPLSMKAGARSAETVLKLMNGETVEYSENASDHAIYSRYDQSVCINPGKGEAIRGLIFDLDDTIYSEKEYVHSGFKAVALYLGAEEYAARLWQLFEEGKPAIDQLLTEIGRTEEKNQALDIYRNHKPTIHIYDGVKELITDLKAQGYKIGVITDGRPEGQRNKIEALGLNAIVDDIIITDELGGIQFRKPCDIAYRIMQTKWKLPASQIVYIGDNTDKDFQAPKQLGMRSIWFMNKEGLHPFGNCSDITITDFHEIAKILEKVIN